VERYTAPASRLARDAVRARLTLDRRLSADEFLAAHAVPFAAAVRADLDAVAGFDTVQGSRFALNDAERAVFQEHGFVLAPRLARPNFLSGYVDLYLADQPVYLSADLVLNALHESFDTLIADAERDALAPSLTRAIEGMRTAMRGPAGATLRGETRADVDTYLAVALGLLKGEVVAPVAGGDANAVRDLITRATTAEGTAQLTLFGAMREVDLSQMRPRSHYAGDAALERYFRAVMFLGREGVRLIDVRDVERVLDRRQVAAALALDALTDADTRAVLTQLDTAIASIAGEPEALGFADLAALRTAIAAQGGLDAANDAQLMAAIDTVRGERPRVATSLLVHPDGFVGTVPQPVAFSLAPQRYTPDSRVLTHVSFDRIDQGRVVRMLPDPLDAAFGALGNDQAASLLAPGLARYNYATELENTRALIDAHEQGYWQRGLYASWMASLRTLSPRETLFEGATLPAVMKTEAWGRRLLNTQLAAWAEVRHDTVLYTAQSYSISLGCSYPSAYVDPYPELWRSLGRWVEQARTLIANVRWSTTTVRDRWSTWAGRAEAATRRLGAIAEAERDGRSMSADDLAWVNQALNAREVSVVCATEIRVDGGWLYDLYEPRRTLGESRSIVADVHTAPDNERGERVGHVLHIGTAAPQAMVVVAGPAGQERAYVGFVSSYRERTTRDFDRLTDQRWRAEIDRAMAPTWVRSISAAPR
jgi:hypothetical protein